MPTSPKVSTSPDALRWLVESRNKIQDLMLRLHENPNHPNGRAWQRHIGAAFSLWRAVFLCYDANTDPKRRIEPDAKAFLKKVIERNAIGFSEDIAARAWTAGYYINNALFRLEMPTLSRIKRREQRQHWENAFNSLNARVPPLKEQL